MDMIERACRAICDYNGIAPDDTVDGEPAWQSYREEILGLIAAIQDHKATDVGSVTSMADPDFAPDDTRAF